jgi:hypothetical protein
MIRRALVVTAAAVVCSVLVMNANAGRQTGDSGNVMMLVSPQTIVIGSDSPCVTVHLAVPLSAVNRSSVELSGIAPYLVKADSRGDLVAKFRSDKVEAIVAPPSATLTLTGVMVDGEPFSYSATVTVIKRKK